METKRLTEISYLRSFAIIAIVIYHSFCPYMRWQFVESDYNATYHSIFSIWLGARMPLFLFISGFLFSYLLHQKNKYKSYPGFIANKSKRLILPYLVFASLLMLSHNSFSWVNLMRGYWHLWFILMLFWSFLITWPLKLIKNSKAHILILIVFTAISFYAKPNIEFGIKYLAYYYIWFLWGYFIAIYKDNLTIFFSKKAILIYLLCWFVTCFIRDYFGIDQAHILYPVRYLSNLSFILASYSTIHILTKKGVLYEHPYINALNQYSYGIYIAHIWIITMLFCSNKDLSFKINNWAEKWPIIFPFILSLISFTGSVILTRLFLKTKPGRFLLG